MTMRRILAVAAAAPLALVTACSPSGVPITVVNDCEAEISVSAWWGGEDGVENVSVNTDFIEGNSTAVLHADPSLWFLSVIVFRFNPPLVTPDFIEVDLGAWADSAGAASLVVGGDACTGLADELLLEITG